MSGYSPPQQNANHPEYMSLFERQLDSLSRRFRLADIINCKSIRDRYEHYAFRLHSSYVTALTARPALGDRGFCVDNQDGEIGRTLSRAHLDTVHTFLDFSAISNMPVRTWWMVHFVLDAALELCSVAQAPDGQLIAGLLPRLLQVLESSGNILSRRHQDGLAVVSKIGRELGRQDGDRSTPRVPPEEVRMEVRDVRGALALGDDMVGNGLVQQGLYGL